MLRVPLVRSLLCAILIKIVGLTILYMLFFLPFHKFIVDENTILHDVFQNK